MTPKHKALESRTEKPAHSKASIMGMKSYHTHSKHNPKTGYLELSKNAPKRARDYENSLGKKK